VRIVAQRIAQQKLRVDIRDVRIELEVAGVFIPGPNLKPVVDKRYPRRVDVI
jgi:hypothetical protein